MSTTQKPVLICGAGLASLLFAKSLLRYKIPFQIFERDATINFRGQGYRLRLSKEGLEAIESVLGPKDFQNFYNHCGKTAGAGFAVIDGLTGQILKDNSGANTQLAARQNEIIGISRGDMRKLFMEGCEESIRWSANVAGYELTESGVRVVFADGTKSDEGSLLVGGEGIYSRVARQLSQGKLKTYDTGARGIHGQSPTAAFKDLGEGVFRIVDDSRPAGNLFLITNVLSGDKDDPEKQFGWTMSGVPGAIRAPNDDYSIVGKQAADLAKNLTAKWHSSVKPLFDQMVENEAAFWKITCSTPTGVPEWENQLRVTVIGDAVHSMTPEGGIGANTALRDSALLGRLLAEAGGYKDGITAAYEKEMRVYGSEAVKTSYDGATSRWGIKIDPATSPTV